jgi:hypothetical protein
VHLSNVTGGLAARKGVKKEKERAGFLTFLQTFEKAVPIQIVPEDFLPMVAPVYVVIDGARILNSKFARHALTGLL